MGDYRFVTEWQVEAPVARVWDAIVHPEAWPRWWRGVIAVDPIAPGGADGIGDRRRYTWRSRLPYSLVFEMEVTRSERPRLLEGHASGELEGTGTWTFAERDGGTRVRYLWAVRTTKRWMDLPIPFARRLFEQNHDIVMGWGAVGLGTLLDVRVADRTREARTESAAG
jgi:uncharacterized protein YndB with AHSA1/START domain